MCHPQSETLAEAALGPPPLEPPPCTQAPPAWKQRVRGPLDVLLQNLTSASA